MSVALMRTGRLRSFPTAAFFAAVVGLVALAAAQAQTFDTPPRPSAPRPLSINAPIEQRLPNGLRVVLAERRGVQLVTAQLVVLSGSEVDPPQRAGAAAMTASLLTKGTSRHSASALASAAESLGGALESSASWHESVVAITVTVPKLDAALGLVSETVQQPSFAPAELDRLRVQALDGLKLAYSHPGTLAALAAEHMLFGNGAYGHPANGTPASLGRISRADLLALHATHYRPGNAVLVLAGDIGAATALQMARRHFGGWKVGGGLPAASSPLVAGTGLPQTAAAIDFAQSGQAAVVLALPVPPLGANRDSAAVMNSVLGAGYSSRLNQEIRIKRGLSYFAGSRLDVRRNGGVLRLVVQTKNESAAEVETLLQSELDRLIATPVGNEELATRKATLIGDFSRSVESTTGLASAITALIVADRPTAELRTRIDSLAAVSAADVQRLAGAYLGAAQRRVVVVGESAVFAEALKASAPTLVVVPAALLDLERDDGLTVPTGSRSTRPNAIP